MCHCTSPLLTALHQNTMGELVFGRLENHHELILYIPYGFCESNPDSSYVIVKMSSAEEKYINRMRELITRSYVHTNMIRLAVGIEDTCIGRGGVEVLV